jgi:hypothetical protein
VAVVFCASPNTCATCVRNDVTGPSSGISTAFEDWRAEEARVDFVPEAVDVRVERVDVRPGMFAVRPE